ncbi:DUF6562 domain-containing protein [Alistipes ihumii]|uniref:DUF6562 domain-containing protein n=1 Tax=Alistipes ihumii TaxID=1470347 RepID=UPI002671C2AD|nr:DUF6562 domain-containing protein [Alistipes ihumii]
MKKVLLLAGMLAAFTACQKDEGLVSDGATSQTITVTIPQGMQTRATAADFGNGAKVDRCLLQIYRSGTTPAKYGEQQSATVQKGTDGKLTATFNLRLVASQTYDFVFWADCSTGDHYNTDDLTNITVKGDYAGNNDEFDAFTGALLDYQVTGAFSENITLRRPFGQLNVKTLDLAAIPDPALKPTKVKVAFTAVPTSFDARKSEVGTTTAAAEYTADVLSADGDLTVDYIWAPVEEATLADFSMTFLNGTTEISTNGDFKNIPIRRNYRTNVSGNLLTKQGTFNVTINPEFYKPDINDYPELRAALANGGSVTLSEDVTVEAPLVVETGKTVEIDLNGHTIMNETDVWAGNDWSLFSVRGGSLTVKNGTVKGKDNDCYACDVQYGGTLIIEDGIFVGNISAVYVHEGKAEIKGGTFSIVQTSDGGDPYRFLLNCYDPNRQAGKASIVVTGGTFENFNPADNAAEGAGTNFVDEGYKAVKIAETPAPNGTFQVVKNAKVENADELIGALADPEIANIEVTADIDLSDKNSDELTFTEHKTIDIEEGATIQLSSANFLTAEKGLTLTGKGTIDNSAAASTAVAAAASDVHEHKSLIHVTGGDLLIDGVTLINDPEHHWHGNSYNSAAIAYWNDANITIRNARIISGEFTVCGMGRDVASGEITLTDSYFESTSSNKDNGQHWAYAMRLYGSKVRIDNCEVKGIQGGVSIESCQDAVISGGKYYTVNTPGAKDAFYPVYITNGAKVTITGGEFSAANDWSGGMAEGTSAVVSGDNDAGRPSGSVILKGGKFSGKAYNHVTNTVYDPAAGYQWQAITDGDNLKWAVVPASR